MILGNTWAQENYAEINVDSDDFTEFEVFGDSLDPYTIYFTGENHNYASFNTNLEYKLLTYLYKEQGVRHFIFEQSPGVAYIIEQIIIYDKKSNLQFLNDVFYDPFYDLVKKINRFNNNLPDEEKIHIHGIDVERFPYFSVYALNQIVDTLDKNGYGGEVFEQIQGLNSSDFSRSTAEDFYLEDENAVFGFGDVSAWGTLNSIIQSSYNYRDSLTPILGDKAEEYYAIIEGLDKGHEWFISERNGDLKSPIIRERFMKDEFERIYNKRRGEKFYGQFGRCHLHKDETAKKCYDYYMNSVANRINDIDSSLTNKVMVIPIYYTKGKEKFDKEIVDDLNFKEEIETDGKSYLIDLGYKNGDHAILGFYDKLNFVIVSNVPVDDPDDYNFSWGTSVEEYHAGFYYGYHYFTRNRTLNSALANVSSAGFTDKMVGYNFSLDYLTLNAYGTKFSFVYFPEISNGDRFDLKGWCFSVGSYFPYGNKWFIVAPGLSYGYGQFSLTEVTNNTVPNLIQQEGQNVIIYKNDLVSLEPNLELRMTLPFLSLNFRTGYSFDVSGKRWRLDGKMKEFTKTSFSSPYIEAGLSFNFKVEK